MASAARCERGGAPTLVVREVASRSAVEVLEALSDRRCPWLLESAQAGRGDGRFSFAGADPFEVLSVRGSVVRIETLRAVRPAPALPRLSSTAPIDAIRAWLAAAPVFADAESERLAAGLPFVGGAVGYFGYEFDGSWDRPEPGSAATDGGAPDAQWLAVDRVFACDAASGRAYVAGLGFGGDGALRAADVADALEALLPPPRRARRAEPRAVRPATVAAAMDAPHPRRVEAHFDAASYARAVESVQYEIGDGNVYQANLTQRLSVPFDGHPLDLYCTLRALNPAPFAAYLGMPAFSVVGSSPERFLQVNAQGGMLSEPIKGTRPRSTDPLLDEKLAGELARSEKDRAENLMIVDLVRNDLGRVCEIGSVRVPSLMRTERYATVHHLVSTVSGQLAAGYDALDAVAASFPPGSMTGAPKRRAIELLSQLEPVRRGVYSGALGYLDARGGLDLSVTIRTAIVADGRATVHVGGGVVADSDPAGEYRESLDKARALLAAIECVSRRERHRAAGAAALPDDDYPAVSAAG